ncbi:MAG: FkbM family methyltransferase [Rhodocyclaceae bacterium]|nr:FkbM family methyltransferase [Rhodocyclaceae bacterium]
MTNNLRKFIINLGLKNKEKIKRTPFLGSIARNVYQKIIRSEDSVSLANSKNLIFLEDNIAVAKTIWGHKIYLDTKDVSIAPSIIQSGYWEMPITKLVMDITKEGMNVLEIGANIGYFSLIFASKIGNTGRLYAFEANPKVFKNLSASISINGFLDRVELSNKAVLDKPGSIKFHILKNIMVLEVFTVFQKNS